MSEWITVAESTNLWDLESTIGEMSLPKGTKMRVTLSLNTPLGWAFNASGAEYLFAPLTPDGMILKDVSGEGSEAYIDLESDPAWLVATIAFIAAHWLAILIAGLVLTTIISFIVIAIKVPAILQIPFWLILGAAGAVLFIAVAASKAGYEVSPRRI